MPTIEQNESREAWLERCGTFYDAQSSKGESMEQEIPVAGEYFEQAPFEVPKDIDWAEVRKSGVIPRVRIMGIKSRHGHNYSLEAQRAVAVRYNQMPVGLDHDYESGPMTIDKAWGTMTDPGVDEFGTYGNLTFLQSHPLTSRVLEDAERGLGLFSLSAVTAGMVEKPRGNVIRFSPVRLDLVVKGATTKTLFNQAGSDPHLERIAALETGFREMKSKLEESAARQLKFEQYIEPKASVEEAIAKTIQGIDLEKFWDTSLPTK